MLSSRKNHELSHHQLIKQFEIPQDEDNKRHRHKSALYYDLNIRALLASFYCGTGGFDVGLFSTFFGFDGGRSWERTFHRRSPEIHQLILDVVNLILAESLVEEIKTTIKYELESKYSEQEINEAIENYLNQKFDSLPTEICPYAPLE